MGELSYVVPTKTDRIHLLMLKDVNLNANLGETFMVEGKEDIQEIRISRGEYSIGIFQSSKIDLNSAIGILVPSKDIRERYFRLAVIAFFSGILWMIVIGFTVIAWTIAAMLAGFGMPFLLAIMEPIGPWLIPIFGVTSLICGIPIIIIIVRFPYVNRRIANEAITWLIETLRIHNPIMEINEIIVKVSFFDMSIGNRIPGEFQSLSEKYLEILDIENGVDAIAYSLAERP